MRINLGSLASSVRKKFADTFNRSNQASLGTSSDGSLWTSLRGTFQVISNTANSYGDNNYPLSVQTMPTTNNEIDVYGATQGSTAALWVTDSGNWWAVGIRQEPVNCNCTYYYNTDQYNYTGGGNAYTYSYNYLTVSQYSYTNSSCVFFIGSGGNCNNYACNGYNSATCNGYNAYNSKTKTGGTCQGYSAGTCAGYRCSGSWNAYNINCGQYTNGNTVYAYTYGYANAYDYAYNAYFTAYAYAVNGPYASCQTCYPQYIRVIQSVANTVSTVMEWTLASIAQSFKVKNSGNQITVSAYSDANMVTQIGSDLVYTPTGATITPTSGIMISPSSYNQGYSIDAVEIKSI
jgi:hypothetical protein